MCEYIVLDSCVRGHHVYKSIWAPTVGETLACEVEFGNFHDLYAVAVRKPGIGESSFETFAWPCSQKNFCSVSFFHKKSWYYCFIIISMITSCHVQCANYKIGHTYFVQSN